MTSSKLTYEDACKVLSISPEDLQAIGSDDPAVITQAVQGLLAQREAESGWTVSKLAQEARRRMIKRIADLRAAEANGQGAASD